MPVPARPRRRPGRSTRRWARTRCSRRWSPPRPGGASRGRWTREEMALRAVLGQQVSTAAARDARRAAGARRRRADRRSRRRSHPPVPDAGGGRRAWTPRRSPSRTRAGARCSASPRALADGLDLADREALLALPGHRPVDGGDGPHARARRPRRLRRLRPRRRRALKSSASATPTPTAGAPTAPTPSSTYGRRRPRGQPPAARRSAARSARSRAVVRSSAAACRRTRCGARRAASARAAAGGAAAVSTSAGRRVREKTSSIARASSGSAAARAVQLGLQRRQRLGAAEPVRPLVDLEALALAPARPAAQRAVERARVVEHRRGGLAEQPAVAQRVADALRGDRVLEVAGVPGQRPAAARPSARKYEVVSIGLADLGRLRGSRRAARASPGSAAIVRRVGALEVVPERVGTRVDRRHQQHEHEPAVARERRPELRAPRATARRSRASRRRRVLEVGEVARAPVRVGAARGSARRPARATGGAAPVGADHERRAQLLVRRPRRTPATRPPSNRTSRDRRAARGPRRPPRAPSPPAPRRARCGARTARSRCRRPACSAPRTVMPARVPSAPRAAAARRAPRRAPARRAARAPRRRPRTAGASTACPTGSARGRARRRAARRARARSPSRRRRSARRRRSRRRRSALDVKRVGLPGLVELGVGRLGRLELRRPVELVHLRRARPSSRPRRAAR